jgi:hypothetical protein
MARRKVFGICHICGIKTELTYEHIPPRSAFNNRPLLRAKFDEILKADDLDSIRGEISQHGAGAYTLCAQCNNLTGSWYGPAFIDWAFQGLILGESAGMTPSLYRLFHIFPLRIIKQIICMFFSANGPGFQKVHPELVRLVLNREAKYLEKDISVYAYFNRSSRSRQTGIVGVTDFSSGSVKLVSEIAYPPLGYIMTINSPPPDERLVDISFFSQYGYDDWKDIALRFSVLPVYSPFPGDYRDRETVIKHANKNRADYPEIVKMMKNRK